MNKPDLNLLYVLQALLETGSVKEAAQRLFLSAPAVSHALNRLRETTGDALLVRAGQRLVPTARALAMVEPLRQLTGQALDLLAPGAQGAQPWERASRQFTVVMPEGLAVVHGARLLAGLRARMPLASLALQTDAQADIDALRLGRVDLEIRQTPAWAPEARVEVLANEPWAGAVRRGHSLAGRKVTAARYRAAEHVALDASNPDDVRLDIQLRGNSLSRQVVLRTPAPYAALVAAASSDLVATVARSLAEAVASTLGLHCFELPSPLPRVELMQAWHPRSEGDLAHAHLRACVRALLGRLATAAATGPAPRPASVATGRAAGSQGRGARATPPR
ncbi:LysR family transcriptional regulator [Variovorax terrae]|uniref:LysR family transcriptional regulator n=1 Tax=Variovorax terrae TaxID=2923278 RepID=A0A9X2APF7_9BURK|nr:LysR family transcriptional regulator [Variovorax terrae]MCJ0763447.1 LysR family transcriptional regulator [Variovorax terrae]